MINQALIIFIRLIDEPRYNGQKNVLGNGKSQHFTINHLTTTLLPIKIFSKLNHFLNTVMVTSGYGHLTLCQGLGCIDIYIYIYMDM